MNCIRLLYVYNNCIIFDSCFRVFLPLFFAYVKPICWLLSIMCSWGHHNVLKQTFFDEVKLIQILRCFFSSLLFYLSVL